MTFNLNATQTISAMHDTSVLDAPLDFDDMSFDIGDALVASEGPDGWQQLSNDHDTFMNFTAPPNDIDTNPWDIAMNMTNPNLDLSSPPILPQIEPNFLDPTANFIHEPTTNIPSIPIQTTRNSSDTTDSQLYVSPGVYLSPSNQHGILQTMGNDSWKLQT